MPAPTAPNAPLLPRNFADERIFQPTRRQLGILLLGASLLPACSRKAAQAQAFAAGTTVLALGDSLTSGVGAAPGEDYPSVLAELTGWEVINGGVSGNTASQGLERLPALLQSHRPPLVLVGLGGNDFLRRVDPAATREALTTIIQTCREAGAQVVLIAVPAPNLMAAAGGKLSDHPLYAELAKALDVPLAQDLWSEVLSDARLRSDQVHANAQGYAQFAQALTEQLREWGHLESR